MIKHKRIQKEILDVEDVICDSCGVSCFNGNNLEFMTLQNSWGYGSKYDFQTWTAHLCEKCIDERLDFINFNKQKSVNIF